MKDFKHLIENFFTHKDFLAPADQLPGTLFTPLHIVFAVLLLAVIIVLAIVVSKRSEKTIKTIFIVLWALCTGLEIFKIIWESVSGRVVALSVGGILPLYICSVYMYAMPLAIWGKGVVKKIGCGYVCTLGFIGALANFIYPVNVVSRYSVISFAGMHTMFFHGIMLFTFLVMLISGYHRYTKVTKWYELLLPSVAVLVVSIPANLVNYLYGADYMFFKGNFFPISIALGSLPDWAATIIMYIAYIVICALFYLPSFIKNKRKKHTQVTA